MQGLKEMKITWRSAPSDDPFCLGGNIFPDILSLNFTHAYPPPTHRCAAAAAAAAKSLQSCPTLCDPIDSSPPGSPVPGILQARTLAWVAISFSNA